MVNFYSDLSSVSQMIYNKPTRLIDPFFTLKLADTRLGTDMYYSTRNWFNDNVGEPVYEVYKAGEQIIEESVDYIKIALFLGGLYVISSFVKK